MSFLPMAPPPKSPLARYRLLSPTASVRVSPLCLGAMNFGDAWKSFMGVCEQPTVEGILDFFYEQLGRHVLISTPDEVDAKEMLTPTGNFIDTSNNYQLQESERWIGEWMRKRGVRDEMVIATKYTTNYLVGPSAPNIMINFNGNGSKSLMASVKASLEKLLTDYLDILFVHWWDYSTSVPELMHSLNNLVVSGKVLYLGVSDTPAWVVSKANEYARSHGLRQFSVYQGRWSAASREFEREIIPMCKAEGMGIMPFGALGGGKFKSEEQRNALDIRKVTVSDHDIQVSKVLEIIANRENTAITSVALAYVMHKAPYVFPIVGGRKIEHMKGSIEALTLALTENDIMEIEGAVPFDLGFPHNMIWGPTLPQNYQEAFLLKMGGTSDHVPEPKPIAPSKGGE